MSRETTDTSNFGNQLPTGRRSFMVEKVERKTGKSNSPFYVWSLSYQREDGERDHGEQILLPNMMGPLLRVLNCKEVSPNKFDWDTEVVLGETFMATVDFVADKKDASKMRQQMTDFAVSKEESATPF